MSYRTPEGVPLRGAISLYRSAALSAGPSGTYVVLPFDAEAASPAKSGFAHSTSSSPELATCEAADRYLATGAVTFDSALSLQEARAEIQVNSVQVAEWRLGASLLGLTSGPWTLPISRVLYLARGDVVRVRFAGVGLAGAALVVGAANTRLELIAF